MTPLRERMIADMTLAGLAAGTQSVYVQAVRGLAAHTGAHPINSARTMSGVPAHARAWGGARHLQDRPFRDPLPVLPDAGARLAAVWEKDSASPVRSGCRRLSDAQVRRLLGGAVRNPVHKACFTLMYACGLRISEAATLEVTAIDTAHGVLRVIGKGDKERRVPLPEPVLNDLRAASGATTTIRAGCSPTEAAPPAQHRCPGRTFAPPPGRRAGRSRRPTPYPAPQLCHPAAGERRRYPHRPGSARS